MTMMGGKECSLTTRSGREWWWPSCGRCQVQRGEELMRKARGGPVVGRLTAWICFQDLGPAGKRCEKMMRWRGIWSMEKHVVINKKGKLHLSVQPHFHVSPRVLGEGCCPFTPPYADSGRYYHKVTGQRRRIGRVQLRWLCWLDGTRRIGRRAVDALTRYLVDSSVRIPKSISSSSSVRIENNGRTRPATASSTWCGPTIPYSYDERPSRPDRLCAKSTAESPVPAGQATPRGPYPRRGLFTCTPSLLRLVRAGQGASGTSAPRFLHHLACSAVGALIPASPHTLMGRHARVPEWRGTVR